MWFELQNNESEKCQPCLEQDVLVLLSVFLEELFALLLCVVVCVRVCKGDAGRGAERYSERERASGQVSAGRGEAGT